jgi:hypothetical protein
MLWSRPELQWRDGVEIALATSPFAVEQTNFLPGH